MARMMNYFVVQTKNLSGWLVSALWTGLINSFYSRQDNARGLFFLISSAQTTHLSCESKNNSYRLEFTHSVHPCPMRVHWEQYSKIASDPQVTYITNFMRRSFVFYPLIIQFTQILHSATHLSDIIDIIRWLDR